MYYAGQSGIAGAIGNLAGVSFPIRGGASVGKPLLPNQKELKGDKRDPSFPPEEAIPLRLPLAGIPGSSNLPGAIGNMQGVANATFFGGPQIADANFAPKTEGRYSYPPGMEGVVDVAYPADSSKYGQPINSPVHPGRPIEMNRAEFEGLQRVRQGLDSVPANFQNKMVY
jgi:hypothetical protein